MPSIPRTVEVTNFLYNLLLLINIIAHLAEWPVTGEICDLLLAIQVLAKRMCCLLFLCVGVVVGWGGFFLCVCVCVCVCVCGCANV